MNYPALPLSFGGLVKLSLKYYIKTFVAIFGYVVLIVLIKWGMVSSSPLPMALDITLWTVFVLMILFLQCLMIYEVHLLWLNQLLSFKEKGLHVAKRFLSVLSAYIIISIVLSLIFVFAHWIFTSVLHTSSAFITIGTLIGIGLLIIGIILFTFFTVPLLLTEEISVGKAFQTSALLTSKNWLYVLILYVIIIFLYIFLLPTSKHAIWLQQHHLMLINDLVLLAIILPFFFNMLMLLMNDLKIQENSL